MEGRSGVVDKILDFNWLSAYQFPQDYVPNKAIPRGKSVPRVKYQWQSSSAGRPLQSRHLLPTNSEAKRISDSNLMQQSLHFEGEGKEKTYICKRKRVTLNVIKYYNECKMLLLESRLDVDRFHPCNTGSQATGLSQVL